MQQEDGFLSGGLYWQCWLPGKEPRAVILLVHGLAEHSGRYEHVAEHLVAHDYAVYAVDHIGHGRSPGDRVALNHFDDLLAGVDALYQHATRAQPNRPVTLIGHSMGGLIAALSSVRHPSRYQALVLSGPAIIAPDAPPAWQLLMVRLLSRLAPKAGVLSLEAAAISTDPAVVADYLADPLVYNGKITARMAAVLFDAMQALRNDVGAIRLPVLAMHGEADRLTDPAGSALLIERAGSDDKTLQLFPGMYHEIFNEPDRERVLSTLVDWLDARH